MDTVFRRTLIIKTEVNVDFHLWVPLCFKGQQIVRGFLVIGVYLLVEEM